MPCCLIGPPSWPGLIAGSSLEGLVKSTPLRAVVSSFIESWASLTFSSVASLLSNKSTRVFVGSKVFNWRPSFSWGVASTLVGASSSSVFNTSVVVGASVTGKPERILVSVVSYLRFSFFCSLSISFNLFFSGFLLYFFLYF